MRVVISGGTGFVGRPLCGELARLGHTVQVLTRDPESARSTLGSSAEPIHWDGSADGPWQRVLDGADAVINLVGESIAGGRWTSQRKRRIRDSRIHGTHAIVAAIQQAQHKPATLVSASGVNYYGPRDDPVTEDDPPGQDFLARVVIDWEREAQAAETLGVRVAMLRFGVILGKGGGALPQMVLPFRLFMGGPLGSGQQWLSWVHLTDAVSMILWALQDSRLIGPINAVAPESVRNREFSQSVGRALGRPCWLPTPGFALRLALGEMADALLLSGAPVVPRKALDLGHSFSFPTADRALQDALN